MEGVSDANFLKPLPFREGQRDLGARSLVAAGGGHRPCARPMAPTPTQCQVNRPPDGLGHAGGMTGLTLLKGRGF
ncbi:protein of unknown function [uncultured Sphingopyxis sp.]|uniref:Uncharacterized protein n=1 Tax=uncultured Sphingopyxis sp. TaxID=310581 RepID=A0A1Y5PYI6_9SPHN|nr:protein of unknown function [uncultured Sphingopyxis sp.]